MSEDIHIPDETVDAFLTNKIQEARPGAVVYKLETETEVNYILREKDKEDVSLGKIFKHAKQAVISLVKAKRNEK